jgi:type I restriction enzyme S subunit
MSDDTTLDDFSVDSKERADEPHSLSDESERGSEWGKKPLGDIFNSIYSGGTPKRGVDDYYNGSIPFVKIEDLNQQQGSGITTAEEHITEQAIEETSARSFDSGTLLMTIYGSLAETAMVHERVATNQGILGLWGADVDNTQYVRYAVDNTQAKLASLSRQTTQANLGKGIVKKHKIPVPTLSEQRKIATVLHTVDQAIQKTKEIVEQNRQLKLGVVQDLFSNGFTNETSRSKWFGTVPSDWEVDRLDELAHVTKLAGYEYTNDFDYDKEGDIIAVRALNLKGNRLNLDNEIKYITQKSADELERSKLSEGDIAMTYVGAYIGESSYIPESDKFTLGPNVAKMSPNERLMGKYLHQALQTKQLKTQIKARQSSTGQPALSMSKIRKLEIPLPHLEQQENIVEVLEKFDRRHMHKTDVIDQYQSLKRGLMQDLLSGEVRTTDAKIKIPEEVAKYG